MTYWSNRPPRCKGRCEPSRGGRCNRRRTERGGVDGRGITARSAAAHGGEFVEIGQAVDEIGISVIGACDGRDDGEIAAAGEAAFDVVSRGAGARVPLQIHEGVAAAEG